MTTTSNYLQTTGAAVRRQVDSQSLTCSSPMMSQHGGIDSITTGTCVQPSSLLPPTVAAVARPSSAAELPPSALLFISARPSVRALSGVAAR